MSNIEDFKELEALPSIYLHEIPFKKKRKSSWRSLCQSYKVTSIYAQIFRWISITLDL